MNMKKFFSLLMAAMMMASVLAGCGGTEETPAEDTQTPAEDTQTPAEGEATGTGTELKFSTGGDQGTYYGFGGVLAGKISETTSTTVTAITSGGS